MCYEKKTLGEEMYDYEVEGLKGKGQFWGEFRASHCN